MTKEEEVKDAGVDIKQCVVQEMCMWGRVRSRGGGS